MKRKNPDKQSLLAVIAIIILVVGLLSSIWIYRTAETGGSSLGYEASGGSVYPINPDDSRKYRHDLELYGGKANVMADEFRRWLAGLFQGKTLGITLAVITVAISLGLFYAANSARPGDRNVHDDRDVSG